MKTEKAPSRLQVIYFATILITVLILSFLIFKPFITVLVIAMTLAVILDPVFKRILKTLNNNRILAAATTVVLAIVILLVPLFFLGRQVFYEAGSTYTQISSGDHSQMFGTDFLQTKLNAAFPNFNIDLRQYLSEFSNWFFGNLGSFFSGTLDIVLKTFLLVMALFYFLKDGSKFKSTFINLSPLPDEYDEKIIITIKNAMKSIVRGSFLISIIQGTLCGIGFWIFGIPNPALWGMVAAISALVPGFGTSITLIPAILFLFFTSSLASALGLLIWGALLVGTIDNFLSPKLIERGVHIHPLFILFSVIGGIAFFGPGGFILGPLVLSLLFTLFDIYDLFVNQENNHLKNNE